jgi:transcription elongation regulator 1
LDRVEASLRERERQVHAQQAELMSEREKEKERHVKDKATQHFMALMSDMVRNADANWKDTKRMLRKDHRWQMLESLSKEEKEDLFNGHINQLNQRKREQFRKLLDEQTEVSLCFYTFLRSHLMLKWINYQHQLFIFTTRLNLPV